MNVPLLSVPITPMLLMLSSSDYYSNPYSPPLRDTLPTILAYIAVWMFLLFVIVRIAWIILGVPLRRQQQARFFIDILESGLTEGQSPEVMLVEIATSRDRTLGVRFHLVAAYVETGQRLPEALKNVPRFLPPQIVAMLSVGEQIGDIRKVLPACRKTLAGGSSKTMSAVNYLIIVLLLLNPVCGLVWPFIWIVIIPKFQEIFGDLLEGRALPPLVSILIAHHIMISLVQMSLMFLSLLVLLAFACGPRGIPWLGPLLKPLLDAANYRLPWRRKRLERDFSAMLALLLDADVPEEQAVTLAAQSTDNKVFIDRGVRMVQQLHDGVPLTDAIQALDDTGEFRWRLANAAHGRGGFMTALSGWHDMLDAKAYQSEQVASQTITTGLIVLNGCIVALIAIGVFQALTSIVWELSLW
jgi:type IV pilus assembly protein PilC